jgi:peptidase E
MKDLDKPIAKHEMLLTSVGPTTEAMQERLLEISQSSGASKSVILRVADGWTPFNKKDGVSITGRIEQRVEAISAKAWSNRYLSYIIGNRAVVKTVQASNYEGQTFANLLTSADMLIVPGGNTYQTMRGLAPHKELVEDLVRSGLPYMGDSAGTIIAGANLKPASLEPADAKPQFYTGFKEEGLEFIDANIVVHASGREGQFAIPGLVSRISSLVLGSYETTQENVNEFVLENDSLGLQSCVVNDKQALSVSDGVITEI